MSLHFYQLVLHDAKTCITMCEMSEPLYALVSMLVLSVFLHAVQSISTVLAILTTINAKWQNFAWTFLKLHFTMFAFAMKQICTSIQCWICTISAFMRIGFSLECHSLLKRIMLIRFNYSECFECFEMTWAFTHIFCCNWVIQLVVTMCRASFYNTDLTTISLCICFRRRLIKVFRVKISQGNEIVKHT